MHFLHTHQLNIIYIIIVCLWYWKANISHLSRHLYGNSWVPLPLSSLVWLTDTSAFRKTGSQAKLFLRVGHYPRAALGFCENVIQVSCPLVIVRNSFSLQLDLKMTFWHHLHGNHFAFSSVMVACLQTGPLWGKDYEWILNNTKGKEERERQRQRTELRGGFPGRKTRSEFQG